MSSESATYYVKFNKRLRLARLAESRRAAENAEASLKQAIEQATRIEKTHSELVPAAHGAAPKRPHSSVSADELERYVAEVSALTNRIGVETDRAEALAQLRAFRGTPQIIQHVTDWSGKPRAPQRATGGASHTSQTTSDRDRGQNTIDRIVGRLDGSATDDEKQKINFLIGEVLSAATVLRAENLEVKLRAMIQQINDRARHSAEDKAAAAKMLAELRGFAGADVEALRQELEATIAGYTEARPDVTERVALVRKRAEKQANEIYVGEVLREELQRLGYAVGDQFETLFADGGNVILCRPEQPGYGVQMHVDSVRGVMDVDVVRIDGTGEISTTEQNLRDLEAEGQWCNDYEKLRSVARERGVAGRVIRQLPPGARKMAVVQSDQAVVSRRAEPLGRKRRT
jgi:hypothetical protein